MEVGFTIAPAVDCAPGYAGLPGGLCQCPHYGYIFKGRLRCTYPGTDWPDEVAMAGDVYFFPAGHTLCYEEPSEVLEINPAAALEELMNHFERLMASGWTGACAAAGASTKEVKAPGGSSLQMALHYEHATQEQGRFISDQVASATRVRPSGFEPETCGIEKRDLHEEEI